MVALAGGHLPRYVLTLHTQLQWKGCAAWLVEGAMLITSC